MAAAAVDFSGRSIIHPRDYAAHGLPWFELYDEHLGALAGAEALASVKSVEELDAAPLRVRVRDGKW